MAASKFKRKSLSSEMLKLELQPCQVIFATAHIGYESYKLELKLSLSQTWRDSRERLLSVVEIRSLTSLSFIGPNFLDVDARWKFSHCDVLRLPLQSCFKSFNVKNLPAPVKVSGLLSKFFCLCQRNMKLRKISFTTPVQKGLLDLELQCLKALFYPKSQLTSLKEYLDLIISRKDCNVHSLDNLMTPHSQDHKFHTVSKETNHAEHQIELLEEAPRDAPQISSCTSNYEEPAVNENRTNEVNPELACNHLLTQTIPPSDECVTEQTPIEGTHERSKNECPTPCNTTNSVYEGSVPNNDEHLLSAEYVLAPFHVVTFQHPPQKFNSTMQVLFGLFKRCALYDTILTVICGATEHQFLPLLHPPFLPELHNLLGMLSSTAAHQRQACFALLVEFGKGIETCLLEGVIPYTDARSVSIVPFVQEQKLYLRERAFSCFQLQLPRALSTDETTIFILLVSKVLSESTADIGLLKSLECGDQCFVFHGFASYLATKNHMLEALVKVFPEHATAFVVLVSPSEKYHKDLVDSLLNDLPRRFQSKFFSRSYKMFEIFRQVSAEDVSSSQQLPGHMQALLIGSIPGPVDISPPLHRNDSGFLSTPHSYVERITTDAQEESGIGERFVSLYTCLHFHADVACHSVDIVELQ